MYYTIKKGDIAVSDLDMFLEEKEGIVIFTSEEWEQDEKLKSAYQLIPDQSSIHFCKLENRANYMYGTIRIPVRTEEEDHIAFAFYILENKIIFVDNSSKVQTTTEHLLKRKSNKVGSVHKYLYDFLTCLIEDDMLYLNAIEKEISILEEKILKGQTDHFNRYMMIHKKAISRLYRYYGELTDMGEELCENEKEFFHNLDVMAFDVFAGRANRLQNETQILREYAMQVQDIYQAEIGIRQNDIMKVLTIVTTIFFPLSLITGWYGMNFYNMPELQWKYGYMVIIVISIVVVVISLWFFKKKKFW